MMPPTGIDWAQYHRPVGKLLASMADRSRYRLTSSQVAFYHEHGYVAGIPVLDTDQIDQLLRELDEFLTPEHAGKEHWYEYHANESKDPQETLFHALGAWRLRVGFHDLLWHPGITEPASQLLAGSPDGGVRFWHDQLFCKPAHHGGVVAWHQDYSYWTRTQPMAHLTCWIGLDDSHLDNGGLLYVPGSHQWDLLPVTGLAGDMGAIRQVLDDEQWDRLQHPVALSLKRGEASFHHPLTIHGSRGNRTPFPRRAVVINLIRDGVESASDEPLLAGVPPISKGAPVKGRFFPLLSEISSPEAGSS